MTDAFICYAWSDAALEEQVLKIILRSRQMNDEEITNRIAVLESERAYARYCKSLDSDRHPLGDYKTFGVNKKFSDEFIEQTRAVRNPLCQIGIPDDIQKLIVQYIE